MKTTKPVRLAVVLCLLGGLGALPLLAGAADAFPTTPSPGLPAPAADPATAARALALRLLPPDDGESFAAFLDERIDPAGLTPAGQRLVREEIRAFTRQRLENGPDGLYARIGRLYAEAFTPAQIDALLALTESPDAQRLADWLAGPGQARYVEYFRRLEPQLPAAIAEACRASRTPPADCPPVPAPTPPMAGAIAPGAGSAGDAGASTAPPNGPVPSPAEAADAAEIVARLLPAPPRPEDVAAVLTQHVLVPAPVIETLPEDAPAASPPASPTRPAAPPSEALAAALRAALRPRAEADATAHAGDLAQALEADLPPATLAALARFARTPEAPEAWRKLPAVQARVPALALELFATRAPQLRARVCEKLLAANEPVGGFTCTDAPAPPPRP